MARSALKSRIREFLKLVFFIDGASGTPDASRDQNSITQIEDRDTDRLWSPSLFDFFKNSAGKHSFRLFCFTTLKIPLEFVSVLLLAPLLASLESGTPAESVRWMIFLCLGLIAQGVNQNHFFHSEVMIMSSIERLGIRRLFHSRRTDLVNSATNDLPILTELPIVFAEVYACAGIILLGVVLLFQKVGWASVVAIGLIVALSPIAARLNSKVAKLNDELSDRRNDRVKLLLGLHKIYPTLKSLNSEERFLGRLDHVRSNEENAMKKMIMAVVFPKLIYYFSSALVALGTFGVFVSMGGAITVEVVFSTFLILKIIDFPISSISDLTIMYARTKASYFRIRTPVAPDSEENTKGHNSNLRVFRENGATTLKLSEDENQAIAISNGSMISIVGPMGGGKTTFLEGLFRSLNSSARVHMVSQRPFLFRGTIRDNVRLDSNISDSRILETLTAARLSPDEFQGELLEKVLDASGANISGGQRQRLAIARALVSDADFLLFDDSFSAVDPETRRELFENIRSHKHKYKCVFFVSNLELEVKASDHVIKIADFTPTVATGLKQVMPYFISTANQSSSEEIVIDRQQDRPAELPSKSTEPEVDNQFWATLWTYIRSINSSKVPWQLPLVMMLVFLGIVAGNLQNSFFQIWSSPGSDVGFLANKLLGFLNEREIETKLSLNGLGVFAALAFISLVVVSLRLVLWEVFTIRGASRLLRNSVAGLLGTSSSNLMKIKPHDLDQRLSDDFNLIDDRAKNEVDLALSSSIDYLIAASMVFLLSIKFVGLYALFLVIWILLFRRYLNSSVAIRRKVLEAKGRWIDELKTSGESRLAITYAAADGFMFTRLNESLDTYQYKSLQINIVSRWFLGLTPALGSALLLAVLFVMRQSNESAVLTAVAVTFSLQQWMVLNVIARCLQGIKSYSLSMKRVFDLARAPEVRNVDLIPNLDSKRSSDNSVTVDEATFGYDQSILSVPRLSFLPNQFTLISGKTGAGKSTLIKGLLGIARTFGGRITFNNVTVHSMMPFCSYVAQDPIFVEATVRDELQVSNPTKCMDEELLLKLHQAGLNWSSIKLEMDPRDLTIGEQQMLCVVRAVQSEKPVLIFDEVTAKLDKLSEIEILKLIKSNSRNRIVIMISHRSAAADFADQHILIENSAAAAVR